MSTPKEERDYVKDMAELQKLKDSDGWKLVSATAQAAFVDLTAIILDPKTPISEVDGLRQARGRLEEDFLPEKLLTNLLKRTRPAAEAQTQQALGRKS